MSDLLFSKSSVARVAQCSTNQIARFEVWPDVVFVVFAKGQGLRPRFFSKHNFYNDFVTYRRSSARQIKITKQVFSETRYTARNIINNRTYQIETKDDRIVCECRDYRDQIEFIGRGVCKHGYAVLNHLGFNSLADYIDRPVVLPQPKDWPEIAPKPRNPIATHLRSI